MEDFEMMLYNSNIRRLKAELAERNKVILEKGGFIISDPYYEIKIIRTDI